MRMEYEKAKKAISFLDRAFLHIVWKVSPSKYVLNWYMVKNFYLMRIICINWLKYPFFFFSFSFSSSAYSFASSSINKLATLKKKIKDGEVEV